ncbi:MAG TPA: permease prefix domain 1-containing protein, partial [Methylomirabilota bacterium]|nr:permease prefix domain 1-containing protein [Methylomirabilota bacterium]
MGESRMRGFWLRLKALAQRRRLDADLEDELAFHLAQREAQNLAGGMSPEEARHAARRAFGNVARAKETARGLWCFRALEDFFGDLRYSARVLSRNPGFSAAAIL